MAQSLAEVLVHVIFSTKGRKPIIPESLRSQLNAYIVGVLREIGSPSLIVNAMADHVHILCVLSKTMSLAKMIEEVKTSSSKWVKTKGPSLCDFYWQSGYGAFSVSQSNVARVRTYISEQAEHHRTGSFEDEFRAFLQRHNVQYDEQYVWD